MTNRDIPSEEYRRQMRDRHVMEGFCLICSAVMLILGIIFLLDIDRSLWIPEAIVVLGGILNYALAIRAILAKSWGLAFLFFLTGSGCYGLLAYISWT